MAGAVRRTGDAHKGHPLIRALAAGGLALDATRLLGTGRPRTRSRPGGALTRHVPPSRGRAAVGASGLAVGPLNACFIRSLGGNRRFGVAGLCGRPTSTTSPARQSGDARAVGSALNWPDRPLTASPSVLTP